jgi:hypothetical protein
MRVSALVCVASYVLFACSPRIPTEAEAGASLQKHRASLMAIQRAIEEEVVQAQISSTDACKVQGPMGECVAMRAEQSRRVTRLRDSLSTAVLPKITDEAKALGLCFALKQRGSKPNEVLTALSVNPCPPGAREGTIRAKSGTSIDVYKVGRGLYQTASEGASGKHGDGGYHPGIEVEWTFSIGNIDATVDVFLLDDGTPRPSDF